MASSDKVSAAPRGYFLALALLLLAGAIQRGVIIADYLAHHPLAQHPIVDARTYWDWAGRIAAGHWLGSEPFFSAPLYPYLLGILRWLGGGLTSVTVIQAVLDLFTAGLLAELARRRFGGPAVGLLAAGLFLAMLEPASFSLRALTSSLQLPLILLTILLIWRARERFTIGRAAVAGAMTGVLALALPAAMYLLPIVALWAWWNHGRSRQAALSSAALVLSGVLAIAPATLHNYLASNEFFAIQSVLGVNFRQGNGPGAEGIIIMIPGTSVDREELFRTAQVDLERKFGRAPTWREMDNHYRDQAIDYWREDWGRAMRLFARKAYWYLTGRNFGDIYQPTLDIAEGFAPGLRFAPLHTAWLLPLALLTVFAWLRRPNAHLPELLFFLIPLAMAVAFWFSPRYRLPGIPIIALAAAVALIGAFDRRTAGVWFRRVSVVGAIGLAAGLHLWNEKVGFDSIEPWRAQYYETIAVAESTQGRIENAILYFNKALELNPGMLRARAGLAEIRARQGDFGGAIQTLEQAVRANPTDANLVDQLARALAQANRLHEALPYFRRAVELNPRMTKLRNNYGVALRLSGRTDEALREFEQVLKDDPTYAEAYVNLGYARLDAGDPEGALRYFRDAVRYKPALVEAWFRIAAIHQNRGESREVIDALRQALRAAPNERAVLNELAWQLATTAGLSTRERGEALETAQRLGPPDSLNPAELDTLAAALAANGRFPDAQRTAQRAVEQARRAGDARSASEYENHLRLYLENRAIAPN